MLLAYPTILEGKTTEEKVLLIKSEDNIQDNILNMFMFSITV